MASTIYSRESFHAYAQEYIQSTLHTGLFNRSVVLTVLAGVGGMDGELGRPGVYTIMGGQSLSEAKREKTKGSVRASTPFMTGKVGGGKFVGERDTAPNTGNTSQDQKRKTASFAWCEREDPIKVWQDTLVMAQGEYEIAAPVDDAVNMAREEHIEALSDSLYTGNPTDQQADKWDAPLGLQQMCHTTNTYGAVSRSTYTAWASNRNTAAQTASLELLDDADIDTGSGSGLLDNGPGPNLWLCNNTAYRKIKRQAKAEGISIVRPNMADHGELGYLNEYIEYGRKIVVYDPYCPANAMFGLVTDSLVFELHPAYNFTVKEFTDQSRIPGGDKAETSGVCTWFRFWTTSPWHHIQYTNVTG
jgi:hypothetical protein